VGSKVILESSDDTGDDEVARCHADSTCDQDTLSTELVYPQNGGNREDELHDTDNTSGKKVDSVSRKANALENKWSVPLSVHGPIHVEGMQHTRNN
jgi:hypothetical protein